MKTNRKNKIPPPSIFTLKYSHEECKLFSRALNVFFKVRIQCVFLRLTVKDWHKFSKQNKCFRHVAVRSHDSSKREKTIYLLINFSCLDTETIYCQIEAWFQINLSWETAVGHPHHIMTALNPSGKHVIDASLHQSANKPWKKRCATRH